MNAVVSESSAPSVFNTMATRFGMDRRAFESTLMATVMPHDGKGNAPSREQVAAFLLVAGKYGLNPFTKELYAFPAKGGGIQPIVSIDGWMRIINDQPQFDGMDFADHFDDKGSLVSITCRMYRKDREHPVEVTEYMAECKRSTEPWTKWPARMLRHKAAIQAARYAFGFSGIVDPDEAERITPSVHVVASVAEPEPLPPMPDDEFASRLDGWCNLIESGKRDADAIIAMVSTKYTLTEAQIEALRGDEVAPAHQEEIAE